MAFSELVVSLDLDGKKFNAGIRIAKKDLDKFRTSLAKTNGPLRRSSKSVKTWGRTFRDTFIVLGLARAAFQNLISVVNLLPRAMLEANAEIERMQALMMGLDTSTNDAAKSLSNANENIQKLFTLSSNSPFAINAVTDSFVKMKVAGLDPLAGPLQALTDSVAKFGGTTEQLKRASIAIQQMAGKGVISMEELRQQLGEAVPNAMATMSRAIGIRMEALVDIISQGNLEAVTALKAMFQQMAIENSGAAEKMSKTWNGTMNRMRNQFTLLMKAVGDAGAFEAFKKQLDEIVGLMSDDTIREFAVTLGAGMADLVVGLRKVVSVLIEFNQIITLAFKVFLGTAVANGITSIIGRLGGLWAVTQIATLNFTKWTFGIGAAKTKLVALQVQLTAANISMAGYSSVTRLGIIATNAFTVSMRGLGIAMKFAFGHIGLIVGAVLIAIEVWDKFVGGQKRVLDSIRETDGALTALQEKQLTQGIRNLRGEKRVAELRLRQLESWAGDEIAIRTRLAIANANEEDGKRTAETRVLSQLLSHQREIARITTQIEEDKNRITSSQETIASDTIRAAELAAQKQFAAAILKNSEDNAKNFLELQARTLTNMELGNVAAAREFKAGQEQILQELFQLDLSSARNLLKLQADTNKSLKDEDLKAGQARLTALQTLTEELIERGALTIQEATIFGGDDGQTEVKKLETLVANTKAAIAGMKAELRGTNSEIAKFIAKFDTKALVEQELITQELADSILKLRGEYGDLAETLKDFKKNNTEFNSITKKAEKLTVVIEALNAKAENSNNPFVKMAGGLKAAEFRTQQLIDRLLELQSNGNLSDDNQLKIQGQIDSLRLSLEKLPDASRKAGIGEISEELKDYQETLRNTAAAAEFSFNRQRDFLDKFVKESGDKFTELDRKMVDEYRAALDHMELLQGNALASLLHEWETKTLDMNDVWAKGIQGMADALTEFVTTGKFKFKDLIRSIIKMIIQSRIQQIIAGLFQAFPGFNSSTAGSLGANVSPNFQTGVTFASGGVMGSRGSVALNKYANGGIARSAQVAVFGEGDGAEAFVPLPDGRSIPVTVSSDSTNKGGGTGDVTVNLINESGTQLNADAKQPKFDGEKMVLDVVMRNLSKPGRFRDVMGGAR